MGLSVAELPEDGAPQVGVTITGLDTVAPSVISVEVSWDDGDTWHGVRGAERASVAGGAFFRDFVPPLNVDAQYRLVVHEGAVEPTPDTAQIRVDSDHAWLQDPLNPRTAVRVYVDSNVPEGGVWLTAGALAESSWAQAIDTAVPQGARYPVASVGQRLMAAEVPLVLSYEVVAEAGALRRLLLRAGQLVLRGLPDDLLEPVAHVTVGDATERRIGHGAQQLATWDLTARQVRPTTMRIVVPWWTYDDVAALWAGTSYADATASRAGDTYIDWQRDPEVP